MKRLIPGLLIVMIMSQGFGRRQSSPRVNRNTADTTLPSFLLISDIHLHEEEDQTAAVTKNSDTGKDLWDSAKARIRLVLAGRGGVPKPKFIIYLGDLPWHAKDSTQVPNVMKNAGVVLHDLRGLAEKAHVVLLFVPGNNDSEDGDYGAFSEKLFAKDPGGRGYWPVVDASHLYPEAGPCLGDTTILELGCYSAYPLVKDHNLVVLVLNTNVFTKRYGTMTSQLKQIADAEKEMKWLEGQLAAAAASHRQVLIAMHVPPGKDGYLKADSNRPTCMGNFKDLWDPSVNAQDAFLDLLDTYRSSIVGIVSSHTHTDGLRLMKTHTGDGETALLISVPGIAPGHGNNPGFKTISYDPKNFQLKGFTTFYTNFFPDRTVKTWGHSSFSLRATKGATLFDQVRQMSRDSLRNYVNSIYMLYNGDGYSTGSCVDTTLYVHYQH